MIRVTVPRRAAEALMDGSLQLLVVEVERELHILRLPDYRLEVQPEPPASIVRAIEAGEHIGIDAVCEMCGGKGALWYSMGAKCPHCADGREPVGSVRPVRVLPIYESSSEPHPHWVDRCVVVFPDGVLFEPGIDALESATNATDALSVYGPAESLVGKFAVEVEDARREP